MKKFILTFIIVLILLPNNINILQAEERNRFAQLSEELNNILSQYHIGNSQIGISFVDINSGITIFSFQDQLLLNPASNIKIITALAALNYLGQDFRFRTSIYGSVEGNAVAGDLFIKGTGDPSFSSADLWEMAYELKTEGIRRIEGGIVVDDSYFDNNDLPPAFEQQPDEASYFRAPTGALSLNGNTININIRPAASEGSPGIITPDPPGYLIITNETVTTSGGSPSIRIYLRQSGNRTEARIWGSIPIGVRVVTYRKRIDNPSLLAGYALKNILNELGIRVRGEVTEGRIENNVRLISTNVSEPLLSLLLEVGKESNNFYAETFLRVIGSESFGTPGTWDKGRRAVKRLLKNIGLNENSFTYINGSGLFNANRFSANQFTTILRFIWNNSLIRDDFLSQLSIGGIDGTLSNRYKQQDVKGLVRAKTGTLDQVVALSGYALDRQGRNPIAFSIILNNLQIPQYQGRKLQEDMVSAVIRFLAQ